MPFMIKAAIFDMDGLIIDSEPFWREAEKIVFSEVGIELTDAMCEKTMGFRIDEVVAHWHRYKPWDNKTLLEIENLVIANVENLIDKTGQPMEGIPAIFEYFASKGIEMAIASSSSFRLINAVVKKLQIHSYFKFIHSAEKEQFGKPHPAIYINTATMLKKTHSECLVFEDSFNGLIAGKAAKMHTIAVPDPLHFQQTRFDIADFKLKSLTEFNDMHLEFFNNH
jgi:mannitol-1-/sugar-/sorbitol-6-/2-deoxyglucose-6-phosphatase